MKIIKVNFISELEYFEKYTIHNYQRIIEAAYKKGRRICYVFPNLVSDGKFCTGQLYIKNDSIKFVVKTKN
jgi:hypothetical protein